MENIKLRKGIILISDFSGFTNFVFTTQVYIGEFIVKKLLLTLIQANDEYFYISEIEGDAILFYKYRKKPCYRDIVPVLERMSEAFNNKIKELNETMDIQIQMSLKFIVNYGEFSRYHIRRFKKLYGMTVIETHQFLKNDFAEQPSYILFSNSFLNVIEDHQYNVTPHKKIVPDVGTIYYLESENIQKKQIIVT